MAQWNKNDQDYLNQERTLHEVMLIADSQGNIINDFGGTTAGSAPGSSDIISRIGIAASTYTGYSYINKFGYRTNTGGNSNYHSVTSQGAYTFPTTASTAAVTSSDTGEDNGGTVLVTGLDANYNEVEETITIGQTGSVSFFRINRARMVTAGTGNDVNEGNISITVVDKLQDISQQNLDKPIKQFIQFLLGIMHMSSRLMVVWMKKKNHNT